MVLVNGKDSDATWRQQEVLISETMTFDATAWCLARIVDLYSWWKGFFGNWFSEACRMLSLLSIIVSTSWLAGKLRQCIFPFLVSERMKTVDIR
jgi:hypothetical protein